MSDRSKDQDLIDELAAWMQAPDPKTAKTNGHTAPTPRSASAAPKDEMIIQKCRGAENAAKFVDLFARLLVEGGAPEVDCITKRNSVFCTSLFLVSAWRLDEQCRRRGQATTTSEGLDTGTAGRLRRFLAAYGEPT